jgi:hypothetical protein
MGLATPVLATTLPEVLSSAMALGTSVLATTVLETTYWRRRWAW